MTTTAARTRTLTRPRHLGIAALLVTTFALASCMNGAQQTAFDLVNQTRAAASVPALQEDNTARAKAQAWAEHLARVNRLEHSRLSDGMDSQWKRLAENVAFSASVEGAHGQFVNSSPHLANIRDARFTHLGVGVAEGHGRTFVVLVFVQR